MESRNNLQVTKMNKIERELKMFLPQGYPMLIEDMKEDLNPLLEPLLMK